MRQPFLGPYSFYKPAVAGKDFTQLLPNFFRLAYRPEDSYLTVEGRNKPKIFATVSSASRSYKFELDGKTFSFVVKALRS